MSCCTWAVFIDGYNEYFKKKFGTDPTCEQLGKAKIDWRKGNTGWEAVQNADHRAKQAAQKDTELPLVNIGGNNYAQAGSALAKRFGRGKS